MMKLLSKLSAMGLVIALGACATPQPVSPQALINDTNILITAASQYLSEAIHGQTLDREEAVQYYRRLRDVSARLDTAQKLLDDGKVGEGAEMAKASSILVQRLHAYVARKAREAKQ